MARVAESIAPGVRRDIGIPNGAEPVFRFQVLKGRLLFCRDREQWRVIPGESCRRLAEAGAEVVGTNCFRGPGALETQVTNRYEMRDFARLAKSKGFQLNYPDAGPSEASDQAHSRGNRYQSVVLCDTVKACYTCISQGASHDCCSIAKRP